MKDIFEYQFELLKQEMGTLQEGMKTVNIFKIFEKTPKTAYQLMTPLTLKI